MFFSSAREIFGIKPKNLEIKKNHSISVQEATENIELGLYKRHKSELELHFNYKHIHTSDLDSNKISKFSRKFEKESKGKQKEEPNDIEKILWYMNKHQEIVYKIFDAEGRPRILTQEQLVNFKIQLEAIYQFMSKFDTAKLMEIKRSPKKNSKPQAEQLPKKSQTTLENVLKIIAESHDPSNDEKIRAGIVAVSTESLLEQTDVKRRQETHQLLELTKNKAQDNTEAQKLEIRGQRVKNQELEKEFLEWVRDEIDEEESPAAEEEKEGKIKSAATPSLKDDGGISTEEVVQMLSKRGARLDKLMDELSKSAQAMNAVENKAKTSSKELPELTDRQKNQVDLFKKLLIEHLSDVIIKCYAIAKKLANPILSMQQEVSIGIVNSLAGMIPVPFAGTVSGFITRYFCTDGHRQRSEKLIYGIPTLGRAQLLIENIADCFVYHYQFSVANLLASDVDIFARAAVNRMFSHQERLNTSSVASQMSESVFRAVDSAKKMICGDGEKKLASVSLSDEEMHDMAVKLVAGCSEWDTANDALDAPKGHSADSGLVQIYTTAKGWQYQTINMICRESPMITPAGNKYRVCKVSKPLSKDYLPYVIISSEEFKHLELTIDENEENNHYGTLSFFPRGERTLELVIQELRKENKEKDQKLAEAKKDNKELQETNSKTLQLLQDIFPKKFEMSDVKDHETRGQALSSQWSSECHEYDGHHQSVEVFKQAASSTNYLALLIAANECYFEMRKETIVSSKKKGRLPGLPVSSFYKKLTPSLVTEFKYIANQVKNGFIKLTLLAFIKEAYETQNYKDMGGIEIMKEKSRLFLAYLQGTDTLTPGSLDFDPSASLGSSSGQCRSL